MQLNLADGTILSIDLCETHNFNWLESNFGRIFSVFDQQDSGNISFGCIRSNSERIFVKYAGARPSSFDGLPSDAVARLHRATTVYQDIQPHEHLLAMQMAFSVEETGGFVLVFPWLNRAECLHSHWVYPPPAKYEHPQSPYYRFRQLPLEQRLIALQAIFSFLEHVDRLDYVAIDFYDGSILYDFDLNTLKICDIDLYEKIPCRSAQPPWGSPRYLSPEELSGDSLLDHRTNVFRMGACAFGLIGGELDRSRLKWDASDSLYQIACRAIADHPRDRYTNATEFLYKWYQARETLKANSQSKQ
ncbi:unnamed protein product [Rotaria socialis]|uniref:Protein kinase domain-containing protein n=1 Tax=Rotaria socialis TaxID=392032 RepID=A0A818E1M2_9BILA|nr:unnamed protein product [Rotaria socialis]CAF4121097.1 unnamed protein product [Rotaria socialis]